LSGKGESRTSDNYECRFHIQLETRHRDLIIEKGSMLVKREMKIQIRLGFLNKSLMNPEDRFLVCSMN
jgi:hypothetical protein